MQERHEENSGSQGYPSFDSESDPVRARVSHEMRTAKRKLPQRRTTRNSGRPHASASFSPLIFRRFDQQVTGSTASCFLASVRPRSGNVSVTCRLSAVLTGRFIPNPASCLSNICSARHVMSLSPGIFCPFRSPGSPACRRYAQLCSF